MLRYIKHILLLYQYNRVLREYDNLLSYLKSKVLYEDHDETWRYLKSEIETASFKKLEVLKEYMKERSR